jgi:hypothetical protein
MNRSDSQPAARSSFQMLKRAVGFLFAALLAIAPWPLTPSPARSASAITGVWSGTVVQNIGASNYSVTMTIGDTTAETDYPELKCGGKLTRVGAAGDYVFYIETITRGRQDSGGRCIDGTITIAPANEKLAWGWFGSYGGKSFVASSLLTRKSTR